MAARGTHTTVYRPKWQLICSLCTVLVKTHSNKLGENGFSPKVLSFQNLFFCFDLLLFFYFKGTLMGYKKNSIFLEQFDRVCAWYSIVVWLTSNSSKMAARCIRTTVYRPKWPLICSLYKVLVKTHSHKLGKNGFSPKVLFLFYFFSISRGL